MARAVAVREPKWADGLAKLPSEPELTWAVLVFTDAVRVLRRDPKDPAAQWLAGCCAEHTTGDLLEARLFGESAEVFLRREDEDDWLCRLIEDADPGEGDVVLTDPRRQRVFLWGDRLEGTNTWFEQRMKPIELPLDGTGKLAVAGIVVYQRGDARPIWRFRDLRVEEAGHHGEA